MRRHGFNAAVVTMAALVSAAAGQTADVARPPSPMVDGGGSCPDRVTAGNLSGAPTAPRLVRNSVVSACGAPKAYPGQSAGSFRYRTYSFTNPSSGSQCVTVTLASSCEGLMASAYLGSFNPANLAQNYLGDAGNSVTESSFQQRTFRVTVPGLQTLVVVVQETEESGPCIGFRLGVQGFSCQDVQNPLVLSGTSIANAVVSNWPAGYGETNGGRLPRDVVQGACGVEKPCPGVLAGSAASRRFRLYPLVNTETAARCVTVQLNSNCADGSEVQVVARSTLPSVADACAGYIADAGVSVGSTGQSSFSMVMQPDQLVWLQVYEVESAQACTDYTIRVLGLSANRPFQYANCDGSTVVPQLNALDFSCFLQRYQRGLFTGN